MVFVSSHPSLLNFSYLTVWLHFRRSLTLPIQRASRLYYYIIFLQPSKVRNEYFSFFYSPKSYHGTHALEPVYRIFTKTSYYKKVNRDLTGQISQVRKYLCTKILIGRKHITARLLCKIKTVKSDNYLWTRHCNINIVKKDQERLVQCAAVLLYTLTRNLFKYIENSTSFILNGSCKETWGLKQIFFDSCLFI